MISQKGLARIPALGLLTALVGLGHWAALTGLPASPDRITPASSRAWVVRAVEVNSPTLGSAVQPPAAAPRSHPAPMQRTLAKRAAPEEAPVSVAAPERESTLLALNASDSGTPKAAPDSPAHKREAPATSAIVPASVRLVYDVKGEIKGFPYGAHSELLWTQDGQQYSAKMDVSVFGFGTRSQSSVGRIGSGGLEPTRFSDKVRSEQAAHFERDKGIVVFSANAPSALLQPGAQDRLSVTMQLGALIAGAPARFPPGTTIALQVVGPRDAEDWQFIVGEVELLNLPGGNRTGLKLTRVPRSAYDQKLDLWLAPAMSYLPVRLRFSQDNGDFVDERWSASLAP